MSRFRLSKIEAQKTLLMLKDVQKNREEVTKELPLTEKELCRQKRNIKATDKLKKWMDTNGASVSKIDVKYFSRHYRGIISLKNTDINELLLSVPRKLLITYQDARASPSVMKLDELKVLHKLK